MSWHARVIRNRYVDSVRLMAVASVLRGRDDVEAADVVTGTAANVEVLVGRGVVELEAAPPDVIIAVQVADSVDAEAVLAAGEQTLEQQTAPSGDGSAAEKHPPRTLAAASRELGAANVALISVPGEYATFEAHRALSEGMHVFLFSDHVSLADELALKQRGRDLGLLVMGPGCGTAMLGGIGLGFANVVPKGPVGIVAAAGTGAQEAAVLLAGGGVGTSQIIGVGGRDLSADIGGIMFKQAMELLAADDETETLLLVSKPPSREVVQSLGDVDVRGKRVVAAFVGWEGGDGPFEIHSTLEAGALAAAVTERPTLDELAEQVAAAPGDRDGSLLGLYSGGSLAYEAVTLLEPVLGKVGGNAGHGADDADGHAILDLGEEEYTQGVPHPMVSLETRIGFLQDRATNDDVGCVLLDVVIGHGSHPDPAGGLRESLAALVATRPVVAHVCGTELDPQDVRRQERTLRDAGVIVAPTNAAAAKLALQAVGA